MIRILTPDQADALSRTKDDRLCEAEAVVAPIIDDVRRRGDAAVMDHARRLDGLEGDRVLIDSADLDRALDTVTSDFRRAVVTAIQHVKAFAELQVPREFRAELAPGHVVGQIVRPLSRVAAYVPGGRYPLPSTVVMTAVPAKAAGVQEVWATTPKPTPETLAAASLSGVQRMAQIGGAQALAAFAFGTETVPKVDRIVGPGNIYVAAAKKLLAGEVGIDFVAGPTEVVIVAESGDPRWIAADMLAQAEHDFDASAILITTSRGFAEQVLGEIERQLDILPTSGVARVAIDRNSAVVLAESRSQAIAIANDFAAEHLCLHDSTLLGEITCAGSVFLGPMSCESAGDYASGPNHVLPTGGVARVRGGLSAADFVKVITFQELSREALAAIGPAVTTLARSEGLEAHARALEARFVP